MRAKGMMRAGDWVAKVSPRNRTQLMTHLIRKRFNDIGYNPPFNMILAPDFSDVVKRRRNPHVPGSKGDHFSFHFKTETNDLINSDSLVSHRLKGGGRAIRLSSLLSTINPTFVFPLPKIFCVTMGIQMFSKWSNNSWNLFLWRSRNLLVVLQTEKRKLMELPLVFLRHRPA